MPEIYKASRSMPCYVCGKTIERDSEYKYVRQRGGRKGGLVAVHLGCEEAEA